MNWKTSGAVGGAVGIVALLLAVPAASAQDTSSARQDTTISQSATDSSAPANATSRIHQRARQDSMGQTYQDSTGRTRAGKKTWTKNHKHARAAGSDSTKWGYKVDKSSANQNPPGYRGMERPTSLRRDSSASSDTTAPADATSRINQRERQDSAGGRNQNPPGYRGMERPVQGDSAARDSSGSSTDSTSTNR